MNEVRKQLRDKLKQIQSIIDSIEVEDLVEDNKNADEADMATQLTAINVNVTLLLDVVENEYDVVIYTMRDVKFEEPMRLTRNGISELEIYLEVVKEYNLYDSDEVTVINVNGECEEQD